MAAIVVSIFAIALATPTSTSSQHRSTSSARTLKEKATHQRERGERLHQALCASCHDGKQSRDLLRPDADWKPGPLTLLSELQGHATDAARGHDFRYLAEHDLMAIVQHVRQSAQLDQHFDEAHVPVQIEQALYPKDPQTGDPLSPCYEPLREVIEQELRDTSKETLEGGESLWKRECASCHDPATNAPALTKLDTIWRRRVTKLNIYNTLRGEQMLDAHEEIAPPSQESAWWPMLNWLEQSGHIPAAKWSEEPDIPWRGVVLETCRTRSALVPREPVPDALLREPSVYWSSLDADALQKEMEARPIAVFDASRVLLERPCLGCHEDPAKTIASMPSTQALLEALSAKSDTKHPHFSRTYTITHWQTLTRSLAQPPTPSELLEDLKGGVEPPEAPPLP